MNAPVDVPLGFDDIRTRVAPLAARFTAAGRRLYLVGGVVRDVLSGRTGEAGDLDLTTDAPPDETRTLVDGLADAVWTQGERFGTIGLQFAEHVYEITTHRAEAYVDDSRKPVVAFSGDLHADLERRDFTVNAMAVDVVDGGLHDPYGGREDLADGVLRTPMAPEVSFADDPLRTLRAARFAAGHGLTPAPGLGEAARTTGDRLAIVSAERIRDEVVRLLEVDDPTVGFALLEGADLLRRILPELAGRPDDERALLVTRVAAVDPEPLMRFAAFGDAVPPARLEALRLSVREVREVTATAATVAAVDAHGPAAWSDADIRRLVSGAGGRLDAALTVAAASGVDLDGLRVAIDLLAGAGELDDLGPALSGDRVMAELGLDPGPEVGAAMAWLTELRMEAGRLPEGEAVDRLRAWWAQRGA